MTPRPGAARQEAADRRQAPGPPRRPRARHRLGLGRHGALPRARLRRRGHRHHAQPGAAPRRHRARRRGRPRRPRALPPAGLPRGRGHFDNIVSVGMFEHVGLRQFPAFFRTVRRLLAPDGVMLLHSMAQPTPRALQPALHGEVHLPGRLYPRALRGDPRGRESRACSSATPRSCRCTTPRPRANGAAASSPTASGCSSSTTSASSACGSSTWPAPRAAFRFDVMHVFHLQLALDQTRVPLTRAYIAEAMARLAEAEARRPGLRRPARRPVARGGAAPAAGGTVLRAG